MVVFQPIRPVSQRTPYWVVVKLPCCWLLDCPSTSTSDPHWNWWTAAAAQQRIPEQNWWELSGRQLSLVLIGSLSLTDHSIERSKTEDDTNSAVFNVFSSVGWHNKLTIYRRNSYSHLWFRICDTTWLFTMTRPDHYGVFINAVVIYKKTATNNSHKLLIMSLILSLSFSLHFALEWWSADSWKMMWLSIIYYFWPMAWNWKSPNREWHCFGTKKFIGCCLTISSLRVSDLPNELVPLWYFAQRN